jgi:hypothetical protein
MTVERSRSKKAPAGSWPSPLVPLAGSWESALPPQETNRKLPAELGAHRQSHGAVSLA